MPTTARATVRIVAAVVAYVPAAWVAGLLSLPPQGLVTFRPPNGLLLALALIDSPGRWWIYALATVPANRTMYVTPDQWLAVAGFILSNILEVGLAAAIVRRLSGRAPRFNSVAECAALLVATAVACSVAAAIGAATAASLLPVEFLATWRTWVLSDALSFFVIVPLVVRAAQEGRLRGSLRDVLEGGVIVAALVGVTLLAMSGRIAPIATYPGLLYLPLPFLVWAAMRRSLLESAIAALAVCAVVVGTALTRQGVFASMSSAEAALSMQLLLLMITVPVTFLAATVEERRRSADLVNKAFNASPIAVAITGLHDGRVIAVNDSVERLLGFSRSEAMGQTVEALGIWLKPEDRAHALDALRSRERLRELPIALKRKDGETRQMLLSAERVETDGREAILAMLSDVTERAQADALKAQMQGHLEQAHRLEAIGQLAGGIAHDFNNVLQAVKGHTELAVEMLPPGHPAAAQLAHVSDAADRAARFTGQLLAFSSRDARNSERLNLNTVVAETGALLQHALGGHVQVVIVEGRDLPAIEGDRQRVEQALMNLSINARDAMTHGGRIRIETGVTELTEADCRTRPWARPGQWVHLRVADHGKGIGDDVRPHIFDPFFTTKPPGSSGAGLGLSTVYAIAERHRALISVDTAVGVGSTFTLYFPSAGAAGPEQPMRTLSAEPPDGRGEIILLAEDEPAVRDLAVEMLQAANYHVLVACDGAEAETIIRARARDLHAAVLDVVMPHRNGRQVYDTLRGVRPELPVIFCTGFSFGELGDLEQLTGRSVLAKPYSRADLLAAIRGAIDTTRSLPTN